jgi:spore germination cell wall hydrolase CwlJ-like protein
MKLNIAIVLCFSLLGMIFIHENIQHHYLSNPNVVTEIVIELVEPDRCMDNIDCLMLAEAIYHEGRGEPEIGQVGIGYVILNRVESRYFPDTIPAVIKQGCHFTYRCDGSFKRGVDDLKAFQKAMLIAERLLNDEYEDPTKGANHYLNPKKVRNTPKWARQYQHVATIGNHKFHKRI